MTPLTPRAVGQRGEALAVMELEQRGYRVVARNHRGDGGEIDIIAWDGSTLCFVEVRSRENDTFGHPLETIDRRKIGLIGKAAYHYLSSMGGPWPPTRFDVVTVLFHDPPQIEVHPGAFEL